MGGRNDDPQSKTPTESNRVGKGSSSSTASTVPKPLGELDIKDTSLASVAELTGLVFPANMADFLTAELNGKTRLDITFVMPADEVAAFLKSSGLPTPKANVRLIPHSSPLWKLKPADGSTLSSTEDDHGDVHRIVELLKDAETGEGKIRARIVIMPG